MPPASPFAMMIIAGLGQRPLPPELPIPGVLGEVVRVLVIIELVAILSCAVFTADRLRHVTPPAVHHLVWAFAAVCVGVVVGVAANTLALPPTPGIYATLAGTTIGTVLAVLAVRRARRT